MIDFKKELEKIEELQFVFTSPTFVADKVTDKLKKEKRELQLTGTKGAN